MKFKPPMRSITISKQPCFTALLILLLCPIFYMAQGQNKNVSSPRDTINLNANWQFHLGDVPEAKAADYDASSWQRIYVPHDWAFENGITKDGIQGQGGGNHGAGIGWYQKTLDYKKEWKDKKLFLDFDGVYMNSEVWVNGTYLGKRPYGYISFRYEISKFLHKGKNTIAVRADNSKEPSARWYHPCGIYAPVRLLVLEPPHVVVNSLFITTPQISSEEGTVHVAFDLSTLKNSVDPVFYEVEVFSPEGEAVAKRKRKKAIAEDALQTIDLVIENPKLWSPDSPKQYLLTTKVYEGQVLKEVFNTHFGFRTLRWTTDQGFFLNGKHLKIKGVAEHWEGGPVAGAYTKPLLRWKLELLKSMGINSIRPAHNPYPPMFYDLCDEIGLLVMDEIFDGWGKKAAEDYGKQAFAEWWQRDMTEWITRDRNHPSVYVYSLGNETHGDIAPQLVAFGKSLDSTRLFTSGSANEWDMEVVGENGGSETRKFLETKRFDKPFIATEAPHTWQTRGFYRTQTWYRDGKLDGLYPLPNLTPTEIFFYDWADPTTWTNKKQHFNSSYDNATVRISARRHWQETRDRDWISGNYRWTGFDYYGEARLAHGGWPFNMFMGGAIDVAGFEKDLYYFYQSQWTEEPMLHLFPHWTHPRMPEGTKIPVWAYSNAEEVELFLNGKSLGNDTPGTEWDEMQCEWLVPYAPGTLVAVAYIEGKEICRTTIKTAAPPSKLVNSIQKLDAEDGFRTNYILTSEGVDAQGNPYPYAENTVYYKFPAQIEQFSLENGNPTDSTSRARANHRALFMGKTRAFLSDAGNVASTERAGTPVKIIVGAILGDKKLYTSQDIAIDVQELDMQGKTTATTFIIKYTTDGSDPDETSKTYNRPFRIKDGDTVRALVLLDGQKVLEMQEVFGESQGLFWGDSRSEDMWLGRGIALEAEEAQLKGATLDKDGIRYKGQGFTTFNGGEGALTWYQENDGAGGDYELLFKYAHDSKSSKLPMQLIVNDKIITTLEFEPTGAWNAGWNFAKAKVILKKGANDIVLKTTGQSGPSFDQLLIE